MEIIKLGGSVINPHGKYNHQFLQKLITLVKEKKEKYVFIVGGGGLCRKVQAASQLFLKEALIEERKAGEDSPRGGKAKEEKINRALDELGIAVTKINANYLLQQFKKKLGKQVHPEIILDPTQKIKSQARIYLAGGWKHGCSTDKDMMLLAEHFKARQVFKITDFAYVRKINSKKIAQLSAANKKKALAEAEKIEMMSWAELKQLVGNKWQAGLNTPFDPQAAEIGCRLRKRLTLYLGTKEEFFRKILGKNFRGTVVKR